MSNRVTAFNLEAVLGPMDHHDLVDMGRLVMSDTPDEDLRPAGAIICCGNPDYYKSVAEEGARLYEKGLAPFIVVSGGNRVTIDGIESVFSECNEMKKILMRAGVPVDGIIEEPHAAHSAENAIFSKRVLEVSMPSGWTINSVIGVGVRMSSNRFMDTFKHNLPDVEVMFKGAEDLPDITPENWMNDEVAAIHVVRELMKADLYRLRGYVAHRTPDDVISGVNCEVAISKQQSNVAEWKKNKGPFSRECD